MLPFHTSIITTVAATLERNKIAQLVVVYMYVKLTKLTWILALKYYCSNFSCCTASQQFRALRETAGFGLYSHVISKEVFVLN